MELSKSEITNLKKWCSKFFENNNISIDSFDFDSEIDRKISIEENKTILREKLKVFFNEYSQQNIQNLKKNQAESIGIPKEQTAIHLQEVNKIQEAQAQLEFYDSLKRIGESKDTLLLEQKFYLLREYVKMVCKGNATGLIVEGEAGLGKSYNILKTIKENTKDFVYCSGFTTSLELYNFLYENRTKVIFFDDTKNIFKNEVSLEILKASLFSPTGVRMVRYLSNTPRLKAPNQFLFEGKIVIAVNDLSHKHNEDLKAVVDRVLYFNVKFTYKEKLQIIADLIKQDYKELTEQNRKFIFEWLKENTSESTINLNFRLLYKLYEIFRYNKDEFNKLAIELIRKDATKEFILTLLSKNNTIKQAEQEFCEATGYSGRYFYKLKAKLTN